MSTTTNSTDHRQVRDPDTHRLYDYDGRRFTRRAGTGELVTVAPDGPLGRRLVAAAGAR